MQEAIDRGLWEASDEVKEKLKDVFLDTEEYIEDVTDWNRDED